MTGVSSSWIWGLYADAHDFQGQVSGNGEIAARIFATHFGHLAIVSAWLSALFFSGGRFSNYEMWLIDPVRIKPAAQIVYGSQALLQDTLNGDTGAGSSAIRITTGLFPIWRAAGITCDQLCGLFLWQAGTITTLLCREPTGSTTSMRSSITT